MRPISKTKQRNGCWQGSNGRVLAWQKQPCVQSPVPQIKEEIVKPKRFLKIKIKYKLIKREENETGKPKRRSE
jgi:hypothetical protein